MHQQVDDVQFNDASASATFDEDLAELVELLPKVRQLVGVMSNSDGIGLKIKRLEAHSIVVKSSDYFAAPRISIKADDDSAWLTATGAAGRVDVFADASVGSLVASTVDGTERIGLFAQPQSLPFLACSTIPKDEPPVPSFMVNRTFMGLTDDYRRITIPLIDIWTTTALVLTGADDIPFA